MQTETHSQPSPAEKLLRSVKAHQCADREIRDLHDQLGLVQRAIDDKTRERERALLAINTTASEIRLRRGAMFRSGDFVYRMGESLSAERVPDLEEFAELHDRSQAQTP